MSSFFSRSVVFGERKVWEAGGRGQQQQQQEHKLKKIYNCLRLW